MKKLLGVLLAIAMSWPASAAVVKGVEVVGEIQTIASDVRHQIDVDGKGIYNSGAKTRALAGLSAELVEDVTANLMFQYAYNWGDNNEYGNGFSNSDGLKLVNANVALHNLLCAFDLTIGRQFYGDEDSAVMYFGPNHYNAEGMGYARALDAAKLVYSDDVKTFTVLAGRIADTDQDVDGDFFTAGNYYDVKASIFGADLKVNIIDSLTAQVYGYDMSNVRLVEKVKDGGNVVIDGDDSNVGFYGAKLAFAPEAFRASVEYARNFGGHRLIKEHQGTGHMLKADIAADIKAVTARGTFLYANEGFYAFGNYTPGLLVGHLLGGNIWDYSDDGVRMFNLGFDYKPADKWLVSLDGFAFQSSRGHHAATWEADLTAKYNHNEYVQLFAGVGYAKYGTETRRGENTSSFTKAFAGRADNVKGQVGMLVRF